MYLNGGLVVGGGGVHLALLYGDGGVAVDYAVEHAAESLDTERQRRYVKQKQILYVAAENTALDSGADSNALIGVDALEGILAHELLDGFLHRGDSR